ncbi:KPN_01571 family protein [Citrobacter amalonaticus]
MNPLYWVFFALLALDAVRELTGGSSIPGGWSSTAG